MKIINFGKLVILYLCKVLTQHRYCGTMRMNGVIKMSGTTNLSIRIDRDLKAEADQMFSALGMNLTTAITVFVRQAVRQKKIPFEIALYPENDVNSAVMREAMVVSERIWERSMQNGNDKLTMEEINDEIAAARKARKAQGASS